MKAVLDLSGGRSRGVRHLRRVADQEQTTVAAAGMQASVAASSRPVRAAATATSGRLVANRYRLWSILGRGGMGRIWLAHDELLLRPVALKEDVLAVAAPHDSHREARVRALAEARAAARINHDGVVKIHDMVLEGGHPWIVMEALSGRTLAETMADNGPLPVDEVTQIGLRLLDALQGIHRAGIVHRDIKPGNVQLCHGGRVVLTDFGIAWITEEESSCRMDTFAGSPAYIAPELLRGSGPGPASDLYSLGATLFAAVEGGPPYNKADALATCVSVMEDAPAPFLRAGPLRPVLEGLLAKEPEQRFTADHARDALLEIQRWM